MYLFKKVPFENAVFIASYTVTGTFLYSYTAPDKNLTRSVEERDSYTILAITEDGIF